MYNAWICESSQDFQFQALFETKSSAKYYRYKLEQSESLRQELENTSVSAAEAPSLFPYQTLNQKKSNIAALTQLLSTCFPLNHNLYFSISVKWLLLNGRTYVLSDKFNPDSLEEEFGKHH